jgi:hypothetical protein
MQELAELRDARCSEHAHRLWVSLWFLDHNAFRESVRNRWTFIDATTWMTIARRTWRDMIDEAEPVFVHVVMPQPNPHEIHVLVSQSIQDECSVLVMDQQHHEL